jgi:alkanesulfonate monooxygenase SsuD/methylene tetrahydromethanopterin reductase-like flavin-dependent oxidoreductase (luciferase family)
MDRRCCRIRDSFTISLASKIGPKFIQKPHIPIYLGGYSQGTFARITDYANGWICVVRNSLDQVKSNIVKIRDECYKAKRDDKDIHITAILYPNITDFSYMDKEEENEPKQRPL